MLSFQAEHHPIIWLNNYILPWYLSIPRVILPRVLKTYINFRSFSSKIDLKMNKNRKTQKNSRPS